MKKGSILSDILMMSVFGIFQCGLVAYMNTNGIWIDQYITASHTIEDLMIVIMIINIIIGSILGSFRK